MNIVVTDGYAMNPGDLSWEAIESIGPCHIYDRTAPEQTVERCKDADILVTNKVVFDRQTIAALPKLKCISVTATGYNILDMAAAKERSIIVTNVPEYSTASVAQMVFALLLELTQRVGEHSRSVKAGKWSKSPDFCYWDYPLVELQGLTMGIAGVGRIGLAVAKLAKAFGMKVIAHHISQWVTEPDLEQVSIEKLFTDSDVLTLHCPLTPETEYLVNSQRLALMKRSSLLINTGRGPLVDEPALAHALNNNLITGAALDVLSTEPPASDNPLLSAKNCYITPHIAWATRASRQRLMDAVAENIKAFVEGEPINVVS